MIRFIKNSIIRLSRQPYKIKKTLLQKQRLIERLFMITYETINTTEPFIGEDVCFRLYADNVNEIFARAPKATGTSEDYAILPFKYGLQDYLYRLYPLFRRIVITGALPYLFCPPNVIDTDDYNAKVRKFVAAIRLKQLRKGSRIDRYINDLPALSPYVARLIKPYKGHYLLANSDIESIDYKLALLSCFTFPLTKL